jgi:hypothetical protein
MSTLHIPNALSTSALAARSHTVIVGLAAAVMTLAILAAIGTFRGDAPSAPATGHLAPAVRYPGTGAPPSVRFTAPSSDSARPSTVPGHFGPATP